MNGTLRLLFIGDVIGPAGRDAIQAFVPGLRSELQLDAVIVNGENSADNGFGVTEQTAAALLSVADFVTLGDHAFDQPGIGPFLDREPRIIRPANWEGDVGGRGWGIFDAAGTRVGVLNLVGKLFMRPPARSPFDEAERGVRELRAAGASVILVDMQAEATSEKQGMGWLLDGSVTAVFGTHTHVPTADLHLLPGGTAYISDVGMTGARDSIIGFSKDIFLGRMRGVITPGFPPPAAGPVRLDAVLLVADATTGRALAAERVVREEQG